MAGAADDRTRHPDAFGHFLLGTDDDGLYRIDDVLYAVRSPLRMSRC